MSKRIYISPNWAFHDDSGQALNPQLFTLLSGIKQTGKINQSGGVVQHFIPPRLESARPGS